MSADTDVPDNKPEMDDQHHSGKLGDDTDADRQDEGGGERGNFEGAGTTPGAGIIWPENEGPDPDKIGRGRIKYE